MENKTRIKNKNKKGISKLLVASIFLFILILGITLRIEAGKGKVYLHMDEIYSHGLINYDEVQIAHRKDVFDNIHTNKYYKDYLEIGSDEKFNLTPVFSQQIKDVHPPLYYLLLRAFNIFNIDNFSIWPGIVLNLVFYILSSLIIFKIVELITKNKWIGLAPVALFAISEIGINSVIYIRMYEMLAFFVLLWTFIIIKILLNNMNNFKLSKKEKISISIVTILGALTHYYFIFYAALSFIFLAIFLNRKNRKDLLKDIFKTFVISAIIYLIIWPFAVIHVLSEGRTNDTSYIMKAKIFLNNINKGIINLYITIPLILILLFMYIVLKKKKTNIAGKLEKLDRLDKIDKLEKIDYIKDFKRLNISILFLCITIFYLLIMFKMAIFIESDRYIYLALPLLLTFLFITIYMALKNIYNIHICDILDLEKLETTLEKKEKSKEKNKNKEKEKDKDKEKAIKTNILIKNICISILILLFITTYTYSAQNTKKTFEKGFSNQYVHYKDFLDYVEENKKLPLIYIYDDRAYFDLTEDIVWLSKFENISIILSRLKKDVPVEKEKHIPYSDYYNLIEKELAKFNEKLSKENNSKEYLGQYILVFKDGYSEKEFKYVLKKVLNTLNRKEYEIGIGLNGKVLIKVK